MSAVSVSDTSLRGMVAVMVFSWVGGDPSGRPHPPRPTDGREWPTDLSATVDNLTFVESWIEDLGITDPETGYARAKGARDFILEPARAVLGSATDLTMFHLIFQGFVARAQGLHEASVAATRDGNPHAAFALLRSYAETAAAILFAKDKPDEVMKFLDQDGPGIKIGRITNHAKSRFPNFKEIYDQMSKFAHPAGLSILASSSAGEENTMHWSSAPRFKHVGNQLIAYAWAVELAEATKHLLFEFAEQYQLQRYQTEPAE